MNDGNGNNLIEALDRFIDGFVRPLEEKNAELLNDPSARYEPSGVLSRVIVELKKLVRVNSAAEGLYGVPIPDGLGGRGIGPFAQYRVWRHLYSGVGPERILPYESVASFTSGPGAALGALSGRARETVWPSILSGEAVLCFALSEDSATEVGALETTATRISNDFRLNGRKKWVSRGGYADYALVYANVETTGSPTPLRAPTAFLVPLKAPGIRVVGVNRILGRQGGEEVSLAFENVAVSEWQVVGQLHGGANLAASGRAKTALFTAARFVGLAEWALRRTVGMPTAERSAEIAETPVASSLQRLLEKEEAEMRAVDLLAKGCARAFENEDDVSDDIGRLQMMAPDMCGRVYERAMELLGSDALENEARFFDGWHQSLIVKVARAASAKRP